MTGSNMLFAYMVKQAWPWNWLGRSEIKDSADKQAFDKAIQLVQEIKARNATMANDDDSYVDIYALSEMPELDILAKYPDQAADALGTDYARLPELVERRIHAAQNIAQQEAVRRELDTRIAEENRQFEDNIKLLSSPQLEQVDAINDRLARERAAQAASINVTQAEEALRKEVAAQENLRRYYRGTGNKKELDKLDRELAPLISRVQNAKSELGKVRTEPALTLRNAPTVIPAAPHIPGVDSTVAMPTPEVSRELISPPPINMGSYASAALAEAMPHYDVPVIETPLPVVEHITAPKPGAQGPSVAFTDTSTREKPEKPEVKAVRSPLDPKQSLKSPTPVTGVTNPIKEVVESKEDAAPSSPRPVRAVQVTPSKQTSAVVQSPLQSTRKAVQPAKGRAKRTPHNSVRKPVVPPVITRTPVTPRRRPVAKTTRPVSQQEDPIEFARQVRAEEAAMERLLDDPAAYERWFKEAPNSQELASMQQARKELDQYRGKTRRVGRT